MTETKTIYAHTNTGNIPPAHLSTRLAKLREKAANAPELWQPNTNDSLIGELVGLQKAIGPYGENHQALVKDGEGSVFAVWLTQWLKDTLRAQGAKQGYLIALTFLGKKQSSTGHTYNAYSLIVDAGEEEEQS
jgi:hypothetical protein